MSLLIPVRHTASQKFCTPGFTEEELKVLAWSAQSPDLNLGRSGHVGEGETVTLSVKLLTVDPNSSFKRAEKNQFV